MHLRFIHRPLLKEEQNAPAKMIGDLAQLVERHAILAYHHMLHGGRSNARFSRKRIRRDARSAQHQAIRSGLIDWIRSILVIIAEQARPLQRPAERLMQQRLLQLVQGASLRW